MPNPDGTADRIRIELLRPVAWLEAMNVSMGNISFSVMAIVRGVIAGSLLFWLGRWSNDQTAVFMPLLSSSQPFTCSGERDQPGADLH